MGKSGHGLGGEIDARRMERRMLLYYTQDGLWDLCLGVCALSWGLAIRFDFAAFIGVICGTSVPVVWALKRLVTRPRAGHARLREGGRLKRRFTLVLSVLAGLGLVMFLLVAMQPSSFLRTNFPVLFGALIAVVVSFAAYWVGVRRYYAYALFLFLASVVHQWGGVHLGESVAVSGAVILVCGVGVLAVFLKDHPRVGEGADA